MKKPLRTRFSDDDITRAELHQEKIWERRKGAKTKKACNDKRDVVGFLGELTFEKYLISRDIKFEKPPDDTGARGDSWDFKIGDLLIDVKGSQRYKDKICVNEDALKKAKGNNTMLVGVHIDLREKLGSIVGRCYPEDLILDPDEGFVVDGKKIAMHSKQFNNN